MCYNLRLAYGGRQGALCAEYLEEWYLTWSKGYLTEKLAAQNVKTDSASGKH